MPSYPMHYGNQYKPEKHYKKAMWPEDNLLFGQDLNEAQEMVHDRINSIGNAVFSDGQIIEGCDVNVTDNTVSIGAGKVFIEGAVVDIGAGTIEIPRNEKLSIGVVIEVRFVRGGYGDGPNEDRSLIFSNQHFKTVGKPLASREQRKPRWGSSLENYGPGTELDTLFYPVWQIDNGIVLDTTPPPELTGAAAEIARYDVEANGHYVTRGFKVEAVGREGDYSVYSVEEGTANVNGRKIDRATSLRLKYLDDPDLEQVRSEPHLFDGDENGRMKILLNRPPVKSIDDVSILKQASAPVTRGSVINGRDPLPQSSIAKVVSIVSGNTTYVKDVDWVLVGDEIDWSAGGSEPSAGTTYTVTYEFKDSVTPIEWDERSVTIEGAVDDSFVDVDYTWMLPRIDALALEDTGQIRRVKGTSKAHDPSAPFISNNLLELALIYNTWSEEHGAKLRNTAVNALPYDEIQGIKESLYQLAKEQARLKLESEIVASDPAAKNGILADNFDDDDIRDNGVEQTAAIVNNELTLPILAKVIDGSLNEDPITLDYEYEEVISQPLRSRTYRINPYDALDPIPAGATCSPAVDNWTVVETKWLSAITRRVTRAWEGWGQGVRSGWGWWNGQTKTTSETLSTTIIEGEFLRPRKIWVNMRMFVPEETIDRILFDGIDVTPDPKPVVDWRGLCSANIQIPERVPVGAKIVEIQGSDGSNAEASYVGRSQISVQERRLVRNVLSPRNNIDPLAQSFTPDEAFPFAALKVRFGVIGDPNKQVILQLREMQNGYPTRNVLATAFLDMNTVVKDELTRIPLEVPYWCEAGREYCWVLLTDDPKHEIHIARRGQFDRATRQYITKQPYQVGVLFSSSNGSTWTAHQLEDAEYYIERAVMKTLEKRIPLGIVDVSSATELIALTGIEAPTADVSMELRFKKGSHEFSLSPMAVLSLPEGLEGEYEVEAILRGSERSTPVFFGDAQIVLGALGSEGTYETRAFEAGAGNRLTVQFEAALPGSAAIKVEGLMGDGTWQELTRADHKEVEAGWYAYVYKLSELTGQTTKIKLTLSGNAAARPRVRRLKAMSLAA